MSGNDLSQKVKSPVFRIFDAYRGAHNNFFPELVEVLTDKEKSISGEEVLFRAGLIDGIAGKEHALSMFWSHEGIPPAWMKYSLLFPDDIHTDEHGNKSILCLMWIGGVCCLTFKELKSEFSQMYRLVRLHR